MATGCGCATDFPAKEGAGDVAAVLLFERDSDDKRQSRRRRHIYNAERLFERTGMAGLPANAPRSAPLLSPSSLRFGVGEEQWPS